MVLILCSRKVNNIVVYVHGGSLWLGGGCCSHILDNLKELMVMARESFFYHICLAWTDY